MKKEKMMVRIIAMLLIICMTLGVFPTTTFAAEATFGGENISREQIDDTSNNELQKNKTESAVKTLSSCNIKENEPLEESVSKNEEQSEYFVTTTQVSAFDSKAAVSKSSVVSRINVQGDSSGVYQLMQAEFQAKSENVGLVYNNSAQAGDVVVYLNGSSSSYGEEGYSIEINDAGYVVVTAATNAGAVYGLRDVLKQLEKGTVSSVEINQPFRGFRGLFVDCARKYFSVEWFEEIIREMAWNNMNTLYISFSNDEGFRFLLDDMSLSFQDTNGNTVSYDDEFMSHIGDNPEKLSDSAFLTERNANATDNGKNRVVTNYENNYHLTEKEMIRILSYAKAYGINVIPELNSPGHIGQVLWYFPEYRLVGTWSEDGQPHYGLDLTNQTAANFGAALVKKYVDFFAAQGCTEFCVGGDEYAKGNASDDQVAAYTNGLVEYVESKGMTAYAWNDGQAAATNKLKSTAIVNNWNGSSNYPSVNFNSNSLYYVLKGYEWKPNAQTLFETWTPLTFPDGVHNDDANVVGSSLAIWCDMPSRESLDTIKNNMIPILRSYGYRMWNYTTDSNATPEYANYAAFASDVTSAPAVASETVLDTVNYSIVSGDNTGNTANELIPVTEVETTGEYELVRFGVASVSASDNWYYDGGNVIDGREDTYCWTYGEQNKDDYIRVDIGSIQNVTTIKVASPAGGDVCTNANVQISKDGVNWETIGTHTGDGTPDTYTVNGEIRYIQVVITEASGNWWKLSEISWETSEMIIANGTYIIVNGTDKAMKNLQFRSENKVGFANSIVTITDNIASPVDVNHEWTFTRQSNGTYYITNHVGKYLNIDWGSVTVSDTPQEITATFKDGKVQLFRDNDTDYALNFYANEGQYFSWWYKDDGDLNNFQTLYKKIIDNGLLTSVLRQTIETAEGYNNDDGRYGSEQFSNLQSVLAESKELYQNALEANTTVNQGQIDAQVEKLTAAINALKLSDSTVDFIEVPIEILDFRVDGVMFEYAGNVEGKGLYELLTDDKFGDLIYEHVRVPMPGVKGDRLTDDPWNGWNETCKRTGLVEDYMVDGAPVYKEATVDYVAKLIAKGYFEDYSSSIENWNDNISGKITELYAGYNSASDTNSNLGTWADTLAKTSTGQTGGKLTWTSITTCYDLAYYILNNMWRSTETDGINTYNQLVDEMNTIRLIHNTDGYYWFDSTKKITYFEQYMYNEDLSIENNADTKFAPINGLGYDSEDAFGDTTDTTEGINFHYTTHVRAYFVYNVDENLYFYFDGDDDVYFYVNEQLAMDIGGAHSHCDDELYLNDVAEKLGLVDGGIYSFDMFYADRHTSQANLTLKTNIKIMDTASVTTKEQYKIDSEGTVIGTIPYGGIVEAGDTIAYSFNLTNLRSVNISDLVFTDESMGTSLSKNEIILSDKQKTNGIVTPISDISVYYHTNDRDTPSADGIINSDTPIDKTVSEMLTMIQTANNNVQSLARGSYKVQVSTEEELKSLLGIGIPYDTQICIYGIKRKATETDRPYVNVLNTSASYVASGNKSSVYGTAKQKYTVFNSFELPVIKKTTVVDYGKTIRIPIEDVTENIICNDGVKATFYGITGNGAHEQVRISADGVRGTSLNTAYNSSEGSGSFYLRDTNGEDGISIASEIEFKLNTFLSQVVKTYAVYKIEDEALENTEYKVYYLLVEVDIIPATMVYYETDFAENVFTFANGANSQNVWNTTNVKDVIDTIDSIQDAGTLDPDIYGYDSTYSNSDDTGYSDFYSYVVTGDGPTTTTVNFNFKGTGFDLISSTGEEEGFVRVSVYADEAKTELEKRVTVLNKSDRQLTLYQIPVVSIEDLAYGTHYVEIGVSAPKTGLVIESLNNGGRFHFDAIRIYNPIDVSAGFDSTGDTLTAYEAYFYDSEADMELKEVRNLLLSAETLDSTLDASESGVVFVDKLETGVGIADYKTIGPNNEVYLAGEQAIGFKLQSFMVPTSIDIAAKSADGNPVALTASVFAVNSDGTIANDSYCTIDQEIITATTLFYDLFEADGTSPAEAFGDGNSIYVYVANTSKAGILSITDLKLAFGEKGTPFEVVSDRASANKTIELAGGEVAKEELAKNYDIIEATFTEESFGRNKDATMKVVTSSLVEYLTVVNKAGVEQEISSAYELDAEGNKVWTVTFKVKILGKQSYTVTGFDQDGLSGASATADIRVTIR